jgi:hypothetical protein
MKIAGWDRMMSRKPRKRGEYLGVRLLQNRRGPKQTRMRVESMKPYRGMGSATRKGDHRTYTIRMDHGNGILGINVGL